MVKIVRITLWFVFLFLGFSSVQAQVIDLSDAVVLASSKIKDPVRETAIQTLRAEMEKRSEVKLQLVPTWQGKRPLIILTTVSESETGGLKTPLRKGLDFPENKPEGYRIILEKIKSRETLWLIGADARGVIFAIGDFLRNAYLSKDKIRFNKDNEVATAPVYPIRGHQLGYRNTANSWDSWTVAQYEQYIRELALFGVNTIENIPFQGGGQGPLMKIPRKEMNIKISEICNKYDLDYRVWTPATVDLSDSESFKREVKKHITFYKECPRLDAVFFPGGDPGHNDPKYVMPFMKRLSEGLQKYHPGAQMWISLQGFNEEQVDYFYSYLKENNPDWLTGVTTGPSSPGVAITRHRLPKKYKHTLYPDITHTVRCQFPVKDWDQAFALTEGREVSNPQPFYYAKIFHHYAPFTDGFVSYSDGVHDDINKILWSRLAWNPREDIRKILNEYTRFFFGDSAAKAAAEGIIALEKNWAGPIKENGAIETTFSFWKNLEATHPELQKNWRWQLLLLRNYYDTYTARRKLYEEGLEKKANAILAHSTELGPDKAMDSALKVVDEADKLPKYPEMRQKVVDYCAALFKSIGLQTSVKKYHASGEERGAILDFLNYPLNNRWWLQDRFAKIHKYKNREKKLEAIKTIFTWERPDRGGYYDNVSDINREPHVKTRSYDATDVAWWDRGKSRERLSTQLFQNFPKLVYKDVNPDTHYYIRISGYGAALLRINGERVNPLVDDKELGKFKLFPVASKFVRCGQLTLTFDEPDESKLNWRDQSKVSDVWLLIKSPEIIKAAKDWNMDHP